MFSLFSAVACPDLLLLHVFASLTMRILAPLLFVVLNNKYDPPLVKRWV